MKLFKTNYFHAALLALVLIHESQSTPPSHSTLDAPTRFSPINFLRNKLWFKSNSNANDPSERIISAPSALQKKTIDLNDSDDVNELFDEFLELHRRQDFFYPVIKRYGGFRKAADRDNQLLINYLQFLTTLRGIKMGYLPTWNYGILKKLLAKYEIVNSYLNLPRHNQFVTLPAHSILNAASTNSTSDDVFLFLDGEQVLTTLKWFKNVVQEFDKIEDRPFSPDTPKPSMLGRLLGYECYDLGEPLIFDENRRIVNYFLRPNHSHTFADAKETELSLSTYVCHADNAAKKFRALKELESRLNEYFEDVLGFGKVHLVVSKQNNY